MKLAEEEDIGDFAREMMECPHSKPKKKTRLEMGYVYDWDQGQKTRGGQ